MTRLPVSVLFVHGISGAPADWRGSFRRSLRVAGQRTGHTVPPVKPVTIAYDRHFYESRRIAAPRSPARRPASPRVRAGRQALLQESMAERGEVLPPRIPSPPAVMGELLLRSPVGGMDQAWAYRHDPAVAARVRAHVAARIEHASGMRVVIAHSLGSVVALEALHEFKVNVDLMVTIGSPLGVDPKWRRASIAPERFRWTRVGAWLNIVNLRDPVAWGCGVADIYDKAVDMFISAGRLPFGPGGAHDPATYLQDPDVGRTLLRALSSPTA